MEPLSEIDKKVKLEFYGQIPDANRLSHLVIELISDTWGHSPDVVEMHGLGYSIRYSSLPGAESFVVECRSIDNLFVVYKTKESPINESYLFDPFFFLNESLYELLGSEI